MTVLIARLEARLDDTAGLFDFAIFFDDMKLRSHLILLVLAAILPVLILTGLLLVSVKRDYQGDAEKRLIDTTRALSLAIDRELEGSIGSLQALATSEHLDSGDLQSFYGQASRVLRTKEGWTNIVLFDTSGDQRINLLKPFGSALPLRALNEPAGKKAIETAQPTVTNLFLAQVPQAPRVSINIPVMRDSRVKYVLTATISPAFLTRLLLQQKIPPQWVGTVIDGNRTVIARSQDGEKFVGAPAPPGLAAKGADFAEGAFRDAGPTGEPTYISFHRSDISGWTVALTVPASAVDAPARWGLTAATVGGLSLLAAAIACAIALGRRIAHSIAALSDAAAALGRSEAPQPITSPIIEVNKVARVIEDVAAQRKRVEEELNKTTQTLQALIQASPVAIDILDLDGKVKLWNPAAEKMFGWTEEEVLGRSLPLVPKDKQDEFRELYKSVLQGNSLTGMETHRQKRDGSLIDVSISTAPIRDADGSIIGSMGILTDITESKQTGVKLQNSRDQLRALAAHLQTVREEERKKIARELHDESGQLLASVHIGLSEMKRELPSTSQKKLAEVWDLLTQIEEHLRNLSHELYPSMLDHLGLLPALQFLADKVSARTGIRINLEGSPNGRLRPSIETALYRTVQEALNNVARHANATTVNVRLFEADGLVHCSIQDDGVGFDVLTVLGHAARESLGLVAMRERVGTLGGTMKIYSAPNQGVELHVTIPIER